MSQLSARASRLGLILAAALLLSTAGCASRDDLETTPPPPPPSSSTTETTPPADVAEDIDPSACNDDQFRDAASIPVQLADLGVPFYPCVHVVTAVTDFDPFFVGEYVTSHELIIVEMAITDQFDESEWEVTERTVDGDNSVIHAQKPGYSLVVAIGPTRMVAAETSIYYTLHAQ